MLELSVAIALACSCVLSAALGWQPLAVMGACSLLNN